MKKEFNFRVWCKDFGEWEKDYCFLSQDGLIYQMHSKGVRCIRPEQHVVQFWTGLLDKNGRAVYDGDIVAEKMTEEMATSGDSANVGKVYFVAGTFMIDGDGPLWERTHSLTPDILEDYEVIGNIFENPELLQC